MCSKVAKVDLKSGSTGARTLGSGPQNFTLSTLTFVTDDLTTMSWKIFKYDLSIPHIIVGKYFSSKKYNFS